MTTALDVLQEYFVDSLVAQSMKRGCAFCGKPLGYYEESPSLVGINVESSDVGVYATRVIHKECAKALHYKRMFP